MYDFLDCLCSQSFDNSQISSSSTFPNQHKSKVQVSWTLALSSNVKLGIAALRLIRIYGFRKCRISHDCHRMSFELLWLLLHILEYRRLNISSFKNLQNSDLVDCMCCEQVVKLRLLTCQMLCISAGSLNCRMSRVHDSICSHLHLCVTDTAIMKAGFTKCVCDHAGYIYMIGPKLGTYGLCQAF